MDNIPDFDPPTHEESMIALLGYFTMMAGCLDGLSSVIMGIGNPSYAIILGVAMWVAPMLTYAIREAKKHADFFQR